MYKEKDATGVFLEAGPHWFLYKKCWYKGKSLQLYSLICVKLDRVLWKKKNCGLPSGCSVSTLDKNLYLLLK